MKIEYAVPNPGKAHVLHVGLRYEKAGDGKDKIHEVPVRASHYNGLATAADKLAYVQTCEKWHFNRDKAIRNAWDADDRSKEEAKFIMRPLWADGGNVVVSIAHHGLTAELSVPNDPANAEANARKVFADYEAKVLAERQALAAFAISN